MKLFNAQSKKTENAVTVLEDKVLGFESLNLISGGIMVLPFPVKTDAPTPDDKTETKYV